MHPSFFCLLLLVFGIAPHSRGAERIEYKADRFERDMARNVTIARGNVWVRSNNKELRADEVELDFSRQIATARGHVHIHEPALDAWCDYAQYSLDSEEAEMEDATLILGQTVITGRRIRRLTTRRYEVEDGSFTHCNVALRKDEDTGRCDYDWSVYGSRLSVELEGYAHIYDAIGYAKRIPLLYVPYLVVPIKTKRQSGILMPEFGNTVNLGTTITVPYFLALAPWQDLELRPSYHTKRGLHLGLKHRYAYSKETFGRLGLFLIQRRFSPNRADPSPEDTSRNRTLGFIGEAAIDLSNQVSLGGRAQSRQVVRLVTDPYYLFDYGGDIGANGLPSLRSTGSVTVPSDRTLFVAYAQHHQSMIIPRDAGVDSGGVTKLPSVEFSAATSRLFGNLISYELFSSVTNFYRPGSGFDQVPSPVVPGTLTHADADSSLDSNDYVRVGTRAQLEPRLIANLSPYDGVMLQPLLRGGALFYHFGLPSSRIVQRTYAELEVPASLYLSRPFHTSLAGYERLSHVFQPRFVYGKSLYQGGHGLDHPFFFNDSVTELSNPRFDLLDQLSNFEYMRFELINRLLRRTDTGAQRFVYLQLSEQYNARVIPTDPRFVKRVGPIEMLFEIALWRMTAQFQGFYQLEKSMQPNGLLVRENSWSTTLSYADPAGNALGVGARFSTIANPIAREQTLNLSGYKVLPILFDVDGMLEYSIARGDLVRYRLGFHIGPKRPRCWSLSLHFGRNELKQLYHKLFFNLDMGS